MLNCKSGQTGRMAARQLVINSLLAAQKGCVWVLLFFVYMVGFGMMRLAAVIFFCRDLRDQTVGRNSTWVLAEGYSPDKDELYQQS